MNIKEVQNILAVIKNEPLSSIRVESEALYLKFANEYVLYIECFFRILRANMILLVNDDMLKPSADEIFGKLFETDHVVKSIKVDKAGDIIVRFSNSLTLEVRIDVTELIDCWRFFNSGDNKDLIVVSGRGIEISDC